MCQAAAAWVREASSITSSHFLWPDHHKQRMLERFDHTLLRTTDIVKPVSLTCTPSYGEQEADPLTDEKVLQCSHDLL